MDSQRLLESLNAGRVAKSMERADAECDSVDVEGSNAYCIHSACLSLET